MSQLLHEVPASVIAAFVTAILGLMTAWFQVRTRSGRTGRTLEQATKLTELVEHCCKIVPELTGAPDAIRVEANGILLDVLSAAREDFIKERNLLSKTESEESRIKRAFFPQVRPTIPSKLLLTFYYALILFIGYLVIFRIIQNLVAKQVWSWPGQDIGVGATIVLFVIGLRIVLSEMGELKKRR